MLKGNEAIIIVKYVANFITCLINSRVFLLSIQIYIHIYIYIYISMLYL